MKPHYKELFHESQKYLRLQNKIAFVLLFFGVIYSLGCNSRINTQKAEIEALHKRTEVLEETGMKYVSLYESAVAQRYQKPQTVEEMIEFVFGDKADEAKRIVKCESGFKPKAFNINTNGSKDVGLFQVNSVHGVSPRFLEDPFINTLVARKIYEGRGNTWQAWVCSGKVGL